MFYDGPHRIQCTIAHTTSGSLIFSVGKSHYLAQWQLHNRAIPTYTKPGRPIADLAAGNDHTPTPSRQASGLALPIRAMDHRFDAAAGDGEVSASVPRFFQRAELAERASGESTPDW
jgi:hypothetical protein